MKTLKRMLLIHWHYFVHETIDFEQINFLTGRNASGKSTIIDAMQLVLLGDTSGTFFNKAANGRGTRTLTGYLRGELGDDEESGFRYLRSGRFTSYIALEFHDDVKKSEFTAGCCFDTFGENDIQKQFFIFDGALPEDGFLKNGTPLTLEELRAWIREDFTPAHSYMTGVNRDFHNQLCGKLGGLQARRFSELLKKAVSFNPNTDIRDFITNFICGEGEQVYVEEMQENIRSYETLKKESAILQDRIALLDQIICAHSDYKKYCESETLYAYLIGRAALTLKSEELQRKNDEADEQARQLEQLQISLSEASAEHEKQQEARDRLKLELDGNENGRRLEELKQQITERQRQCVSIHEDFERSERLFGEASASWKSTASTLQVQASAAALPSLDPLLAERLQAVCSEETALREKAEKAAEADAGQLVSLGSTGLFALSEQAAAYRGSCAELGFRIHSEAERLEARQKELLAEKASLEKGIYHYPQSALDLKAAIESRLRTRFGPEARAWIVAEAAEISDDRWRNVIEGYLFTQRFYILVAPEHFPAALEEFDAIKRRKMLYTTGLVDTDKLSRQPPEREAGSLAEEIETELPPARFFLDFVLGRVHKCDTVQELRRFRTAVTDEGVLYQSCTVRAMNPDRWKEPAIGQGGIRKRLDGVKRELEALVCPLQACTALTASLDVARHMRLLSESDCEHIAATAQKERILPDIRADIEKLKADAEAIDTSEVDLLRRRLAEREAAIDEAMRRLQQLNRNAGSCEKLLQQLRDNTIPALEAEVASLEGALSQKYSADWIMLTGAPRFERELSVRKSAEEIAKAFPRELSRASNLKYSAWTKTRDLRRQYNDVFKMGYDIDAPENNVYDQAWRDLSNNKLPDYQSKIEDARKKAAQEFQEDFLSRLASNIDNARQQINNLNDAMRDCSFGEDSYRFKMTASPDYKHYYEMITDPMLLTGGYNLLSEQYNAKYEHEIAELFTIITSEGAGAEDAEKRRRQFTDYRTYLCFDLEITKASGETERLSKTQYKKSGGETQTPFYIAVLASFVQLYRIGRDRNENTVRLVLFDEAFSKMDGERIVQSIALLRKFGFQVVLAAPPDKIGDIATLVDKNLCVLREGHRARVCSFTPRQLEEEYADEL